MKFKIIVYNFLLLIFLSFYSISDEIQFESENLQVFEQGNIIKSYKGKAIIPEKKIEIEGENSIYNKEKATLEVINNAKFYDKEKDIYIESEKLVYNQISNVVFSKGKTFLKIENTYEIYSKDLYYDRNIMDISSIFDTVVKDNKENVFNLADGFNFDIIKEVISSEKTNVIDNKNNNYEFERVKINLKINEIAGKEVKVNFVDNYFGDENNDPILKGKSTISNDDETKIYKAVFTTCNTENKKCPGWELQSDQFRHDKKNRLFQYKNSWLKMFNKRLFFFPYFSHPDPTVKRKSGFLTPSYGNSKNKGNWANIPYYKILSDSKDMTFNPRVYADDKFILQSEYREAFKNSNLISDFSYNNDGKNSNTHLFANLGGKFNEKTSYNLQIQNVSNENYLKINDMAFTSPLIISESSLHSYFNIDNNIDKNTNFIGSFKVYEDLSKKDSDKYQYIFPEFTFKKNIDIDKSYNGNLIFTTNGYQKKYDTNKYDGVLNNEFLFNSNSFISDKGLQNNYNLQLKNLNSYTEKPNDENNNSHDIFGTMLFRTSYPLKKEMETYTNYLTPTLSARYSPNKTKDVSGVDRKLNFSNIFSLNRIASSDSVEGGRSIAIGLTYEKMDLKNDSILTFNIANNIADKKNINLPKKSKLDQTRSDIIGGITYNPNKIINFGYGFSYDRDLDYSNYDSISTSISLNNFVTDFKYITENHDFGDSENISNTTTIKFNNENSLSFNTSKNLRDDFTEFHNFMYTYKTDCLLATLEYNKKFYSNGSLMPDESLMFMIRFIPFTEIRGTANSALSYTK